jgi:hypothetical protein
MIRLESCGVFLLGSLKNQRIKKVRTKPTADTIWETAIKIIESDREIAANLKPSGWI